MVGDGGDIFQTPGSWEVGSPGAGRTGVTCITQLPGGDPWAAIAGHLGLKDSVADVNRFTYQTIIQTMRKNWCFFGGTCFFFPSDVVYSFLLVMGRSLVGAFGRPMMLLPKNLNRCSFSCPKVVRLANFLGSQISDHQTVFFRKEQQ